MAIFCIRVEIAHLRENKDQVVTEKNHLDLSDPNKLSLCCGEDGRMTMKEFDQELQREIQDHEDEIKELKEAIKMFQEEISKLEKPK